MLLIRLVHTVNKFYCKLKSQVCFQFKYKVLLGAMKTIKYIDTNHSNQVLSNFGITLALLQILFLVSFSIFVRMDTQSTSMDQERASALVGSNAMLLLGFGYLMTSIKHTNLSALTYSLLINALVIQFYILLSTFWGQVFHKFDLPFYVLINQKLLLKGIYCIASNMVAMAAIVGRVNPTDLVKIALVHTTGYTLNEQIIYTAIGGLDAGGGMPVYLYGAYYGLTVNYVLSQYVHPNTRPEKTYYSQVLSLVGTLFLWVFWPTFNFSWSASTSYQRAQIIANTYCALIGSTISTFVVTAMHGRGMLVEDITHASLVGGVAIASSCGILYIPAVAIGIGFIAGIISTNSFHYLNRKLQKSLKIFDFHGVHSTFGIPAFGGAIASVILIMVYNGGYDVSVAKQYGPGSLFVEGRDFIKQGGLQLLGVISSAGLAIVMGFGGGKFVGLFYDQAQQNFYEDCSYFDRGLFLNSQDRQIRYEQPQEVRKVPFTSQRLEPEQRPNRRQSKRQKQKGQKQKLSYRKSKRETKPK